MRPKEAIYRNRVMLRVAFAEEWAYSPYIGEIGSPPNAGRLKMFANISTAELIKINATHLREYRADPTAAKLKAVNNSSRELSARGA